MSKKDKKSAIGLPMFLKGKKAIKPHLATGGNPVTTSSGVAGINQQLISPITNNLPSWAGSAPLNWVQGIVSGIQNATQNQFQASGAPIQAGTNVDQLNAAYGQAQSGIGQQQALVNALQQQGGLQNQSSVFNQQQALANQLGAQQGAANQSSVFGQQQALANQLSAMAQGAGPNPALAQLNQTTGQNVAQQAALMAGQRGAGANAGLIARQAAQQGAATQQQAAGQAATLRAQQQLAAIGALQNQQQALGNLATTQVGQQQAQQAALGNTAGAQVGNFMNSITGLNTATQNEQNQLQAANTAYNNALVSQQANINNVNAGISQANQQSSNNLLGGIANSGASILSKVLPFAEGGEVEEPGYTPVAAQSSPDIGSAPNLQSSVNPFDMGGSKDSGSKGLFAQGGNVSQQGSSAILKENYKSGPKSRIGRSIHHYAKGGKVEAMVSPGEIYLPPHKVESVAKGTASPLSGEKIPGKAKVAGAKNDYANDTVPKTLKEGGIVIPRSVTQSKDGDKEAKAKKFVEHVLSKKGR